MSPATHAQAPLSIDVSLTVHDHLNWTGARERIQPMVCSDLIAMSDGDKLYLGVLLSRGAEGAEGLLCEGTATVAEEGDDCGFVVITREDESVVRGSGRGNVGRM